MEHRRGVINDACAKYTTHGAFIAFQALQWILIPVIVHEWTIAWLTIYLTLTYSRVKYTNECHQKILRRKWSMKRVSHVTGARFSFGDLAWHDVDDLDIYLVLGLYTYKVMYLLHPGERRVNWSAQNHSSDYLKLRFPFRFRSTIFKMQNIIYFNIQL